VTVAEGERGGRGLVDDALDVKPGQQARGAHGLALCSFSRRAR